MPVKSLLLLVAFVAACGGALYAPLIGVLGYVLHYHIAPESQWWGQMIAHWGIRYSFLLALFTAVSVAIHHRGLRYGKSLLTGQEWLMILFLGWVWVSYVLYPTDPTLFQGEDIPAVKVTKILIFSLMLTHVVTTLRAVDLLFCAIVAGAAFLGYQTYTAGPGAFYGGGGRLNVIGGPDFREANGLAVYLSACLPIIGVLFLRGQWLGRLACAATGVLAVNGIVLTRSRGGAVALAAGAIAAVFAAPRKYRKVVLAGVLVAAIGGYALTDPGFWERIETITAPEEARDGSAQSRVEIWRGSLALLSDNPLGVGAGNFPAAVGEYLPMHARRDAHSTYVLCWSELGLPGIALYLLMMINGGRLLRQVYKQCEELREADRDRLRWAVYAIVIGLIVFAFGGLTMSRLYTEAPWWFLALPVCLWRALDNARDELAGLQAVGESNLGKKARERAYFSPARAGRE